MKQLETKFSEIVYEDFYPEVFNNQPSKEIYSTFVGEALPDERLFVVLGSDSGLLLEYLSKIANASQRYVVVDHAELVSQLQSQAPNLSDEFRYSLVSFDEFEFEMLYENYEDYVIRGAVTILASLMVSGDAPGYGGLYADYKERYHRFLIDRVDNHDFKKVFDMQMQNTCDLVYPLADIKDQLQGDVPGIVLGGGPSLDKVIPWLKQNQEKIWIFAASRICKRLINEGITPDFIGVFDPQPLMFEYSKEMFDLQDKSVLITGEHPYPRIIRQWGGLKTYSRRRFPWAKGAEDNFISDGPTVTNGLFGIVAYLGVRRILLAGVDYCFTPEGVCHESGSIESKNAQADKAHTFAINYRGEKVGTNIQLYDARNLFEEQLHRLRQSWPELETYNLNDGAAVINDVEFKDMDSFTLVQDKADVIQLLSPALGHNREKEIHFQKKLMKQIKADSSWLSDIRREADSGLALSATLFDDPNKQQARIDKVLKLKSKLEKLVGIDYQTFVNYGYKSFMTTLKPVESNEQMTHQEMINALTGFFGGLKVAAEDFVDQLQKIKQELKWRALEVEDDPDFKTLSEHWLAEDVPGRFQAWLKLYAVNDEEVYRQQFPELVRELESRFEFMKQDESALEKSFAQRFDTPQDFTLRLQQAFDQQNLHELQNISRQLNFSNEQAYQLVKALAAGMILELKEQSKDALIHYSTVDPKQQIAAIQEQLYPLAFSLNEFEKGLKALALLSQLNLKFMPLFAHALQLNNQIEAAGKIYQQYLAVVSDTDALINYLRLLIQQNQLDLANQWLEQAEKSDGFDLQQLQTFVDSLNTPT